MPQKQIRVLVIGDLMLDKYIWGSSNRLSPEAPVAVVSVDKESFTLGGACNVANNLIAMNAKVTIYGAIGHDAEGDLLQDFLINKGIQANCYKSNRPTTTKTRVMASKHQMLRIDRENSSNLETSLYDEMYEDLRRHISQYDCMILSDYQKGVLSHEFAQKLIALANSVKIPVLCDPKGDDYSKYRHATLITPNKKEAQIATKITIHNDASLKDALLKLQDISQVTYPLITLSEDGIGFLENGFLHKKPTIAREVYDVSGAGDTVIAALAIALAHNLSLDYATTFANAAAAVVIAKLGSAVASLAEIKDFLAPRRIIKPAESKIITDIDNLKNDLKNKKIVFTNGCFDILHAGHVSYLQKARKLGDVLIVGLNSDDSVRKLKGKDRPINPQEDRALLLASLACVSYVIIFNEDTPLNLIAQIMPDVLVKGADYENKEIVGSNYAKEVKLIDFLQNRSTTNIINKIKH
ncbi:D-glycero-beta-D-manno-heptose-7-phosphate kinase [Helicobacter muridarum]|uniref:Bifunctional protein HldE n=1 Tax=Helicobacter muridarum TaxID=216 RepID=A0A4U8TN29_9HELI|nr:D-glycero-beta-D-manno-heptose-7-phosphate kinase [Helicobacter muridarum]